MLVNIQIVLFCLNILGFTYAIASENYWVLLILSLFQLGVSFFNAQEVKKEVKDALFVIEYKNRLWNSVFNSIFIATIFGYNLYNIGVTEGRVFFVITILAFCISLVMNEFYKVNFLFNENEFFDEREKIPYDRILQIRKDQEYLIIDTKKYINHVKIGKDLLSDELEAFLLGKSTKKAA